MIPRQSTSRRLGQSVCRNAVKSTREMLQISAEQLAQECGVTRATIYNVEREINVPKIDLAISLARALDMSVETLFWMEI